MAAVAVVSVSFNTRELTSLLLWSLHRVLEPADTAIVIVDNASTDGSTEVLREVADAGLCRLVTNPANIGHGPGLNVGLRTPEVRSADRVWILDSDCVIAQPNALQAAVAAHPDASIIGEAHWDRWHERDRLEAYSLIIDPTILDRSDIAPFEDSGDPTLAFLESAEHAGLAAAAFPFTRAGYIIHLGRGSLAGVAASGDDTNPLYSWAVEHNEPHYGGVDGAAARYDSLLGRHRAELAEHGGLVSSLRQ